MTSHEDLLGRRAPTGPTGSDPLRSLFDPVTRRHLDALGVDEGWHCWEIGAGGPGTPAWLAQRVGATGRVLATGLDLAWATGRERFEVRHHDVGRDEPPGGAFDLVHARLLLARVADRHAALAHMVHALRPGGWLVIEELDIDFQPSATPDASNTEQYLSNRIRAGLLAVLGRHGVDLELGRKVPRLLRQAGLVDVVADGYFPLASPEAAALEVAGIEHARDALVALRAASDDELDMHVEAARAGSIDVSTPPLISVWGRRPEA
jgi:SAM-dependent methyltransferase